MLDGKRESLTPLRLLREKISNQMLFILILDACEQFRPQLLNRFWTVKRQFLVHLAPGEMAGRAAGL